MNGQLGLKGGSKFAAVAYCKMNGAGFLNVVNLCSKSLKSLGWLKHDLKTNTSGVKLSFGDTV